MPGIQRKNRVGVVLDGDDEEERKYCPICLKYRNKQYPMKHKVLDIDEAEPPDFEDWRQCWECGYKEATADIISEGKLRPAKGIEVHDNPFDFGSVTAEHIKKRKRVKKEEIKDKEILAEIKKGGQLINYEQS